MKNTACRLKIVKFVAFLKAFEKTFLRSFLQHSRYSLHWKNIFLPSLRSLLQCITDYSAESLVVMPFHPDGHLSLPFQYCSFSMHNHIKNVHICLVHLSMPKSPNNQISKFLPVFFFLFGQNGKNTLAFFKNFWPKRKKNTDKNLEIWWFGYLEIWASIDELDKCLRRLACC